MNGSSGVEENYGGAPAEDREKKSTKVADVVGDGQARRSHDP